MAAIDVARTLGKSEGEVTVNQDVTVDTIARTLGIDAKEAFLIGDLGVAIAVPGAPTAAVATVVSTGKVSVAFTAPASDGGAGIDSYEVTSSPGGFVASDLRSPVVVTAAFVQGQAYTFTVKAVNEKGKSAASTASAGVTPNP